MFECVRLNLYEHAHVEYARVVWIEAQCAVVRQSPCNILQIVKCPNVYTYDVSLDVHMQNDAHSSRFCLTYNRHQHRNTLTNVSYIETY